MVKSATTDKEVRQRGPEIFPSDIGTLVDRPDLCLQIRAQFLRSPFPKHECSLAAAGGVVSCVLSRYWLLIRQCACQPEKGTKLFISTLSPSNKRQQQAFSVVLSISMHSSFRQPSTFVINSCCSLQGDLAGFNTGKVKKLSMARL